MKQWLENGAPGELVILPSGQGVHSVFPVRGWKKLSGHFWQSCVVNLNAEPEVQSVMNNMVYIFTKSSIIFY